MFETLARDRYAFDAVNNNLAGKRNTYAVEAMVCPTILLSQELTHLIPTSRLQVVSRAKSIEDRAWRSGHAEQLLVHEAHAGVVLQRASDVRVATRTERHPYAKGRRPGLHSTIAVRVELILAAQRIAAMLQIADARHVISGLKITDTFFISHSRGAYVKRKGDR